MIAEDAVANLLVIAGDPEQGLGWLGDTTNLRLIMKGGRPFRDELAGDAI